MTTFPLFRVDVVILPLPTPNTSHPLTSGAAQRLVLHLADAFGHGGCFAGAIDF